ncbi:hypothetical protein LOTGIDRAFT_164109 [Lottia gigantea]|uniref:SLED domain-containing protein n=1 Tax=Lottia gigantea TaxID=225164 RepID=V4AB47_LOTGI|nr:hypothetical protein LOTGIDRAFT_164109 [Lottia gigantea]ESO90521.1 hypothetical protein LOTGIDRAFT_164109 [Lottia gigantea]
MSPQVCMCSISKNGFDLYKGKSYRAIVEICRVNGQLEDFCRQICIKLECCPNLISPYFIDDQCPENCAQLTKTKYTYYYGKKKKKVGRPPSTLTSMVDGNKRNNKLRKKITITAPRTGSLEGDDEDDKASVDSDSQTVDSTSTVESKHKSLSKPVKASMRLKRKYIHHLPPPSEMRTRGEKRPRYSFERRTHKKILISSPYSMLNQKTKSSQSVSSDLFNWMEIIPYMPFMHF